MPDIDKPMHEPTGGRCIPARLGMAVGFLGAIAAQALLFVGPFVGFPWWAPAALLAASAVLADSEE